MADKTNRTGRVSAINYEAGTYQVTYFDRGESVTREINAISNGEYRMPRIGQIVSVSHNSNGAAAAVSVGTVWNKSNRPAEGFEGLYRKEYGSRQGQAYERYDANTGAYTQYVDRLTGRNCNGEIFDEAKGPVSVIAGGQLQLKSSGGSASIQAKGGVGIQSEGGVSIEAGGSLNLESSEGMGLSIGGQLDLESTGGGVIIKGAGNVEVESGGNMSISAGGAFTLTVNGATITIGASGDISITAAGNLALVSQSGISLSAPNVSISGSGEVNINGGGGDVKVGGKSLAEHTHTETGVPNEETSGPN